LERQKFLDRIVKERKNAGCGVAEGKEKTAIGWAQKAFLRVGSWISIPREEKRRPPNVGPFPFKERGMGREKKLCQLTLETTTRKRKSASRKIQYAA